MGNGHQFSGTSDSHPRIVQHWIVDRSDLSLKRILYRCDDPRLWQLVGGDVPLSSGTMVVGRMCRVPVTTDCFWQVVTEDHIIGYLTLTGLTQLVDKQQFSL